MTPLLSFYEIRKTYQLLKKAIAKMFRKSTVVALLVKIRRAGSKNCKKQRNLIPPKKTAQEYIQKSDKKRDDFKK